MALMGPFQLEIFCDTSADIKFIKMDSAKDKIPLSRNRDALNHTIYNCENADAPQDRVEKYTEISRKVLLCFPIVLSPQPRPFVCFMYIGHYT